MGAPAAATATGPIAEAVRRAGHPVVWLSDPLHGNTVTATGGIKTRRLADAVTEAATVRRELHRHGQRLGGLHLETTPADVTECVGGPVAEHLLPEMRKVAKDAAIETKSQTSVPAFVAAPQSGAVALALALTGANRTGTVSYATEAGLFETAGNPAVVCGPGDIAQAHTHDEWIALRCRLGEPGAFAELVRELERPLLYYAAKLLVDEDAAFDVLQEVWLAAFRSIRRLDDPRAVRAWLYRITHGRAIDRIRSDRSRGRAEQARAEATPEEAGEEPSFAAEDVEAVHRALDRIDLRHREVLVLHFLDDLSIADIAADGTNAAALAAAGIPPSCFYLLRPDGHVGLCGARLEAEAVGRYATAALHLRGRSEAVVRAA